MSETENLKLKKPTGSDFISIKDFNENSDKIDEEYKKLKDSIPSLKSKVYEELTTNEGGTAFLPDMMALNTVIVSAVCHGAFSSGSGSGVAYLSPAALGTEGAWCLCATDSMTGQPVKNKSLGRVKVWYIDLHEETAEEGG